LIRKLNLIEIVFLKLMVKIYERCRKKEKVNLTEEKEKRLIGVPRRQGVCAAELEGEKWAEM
jgi:hypothetical protein